MVRSVFQIEEEMREESLKALPDDDRLYKLQAERDALTSSERELPRDPSST